MYTLWMLIAFLLTVLIVPKGMNYLYNSFVIGTDGNKRKKRILPSSLGTVVFVSFFVVSLGYIIIQSLFGTLTLRETVIVFSVLLTSFTGMFIGFLDDIHTKTKQVKAESFHKDFRVGFKQVDKVLISLLVVLPIIPTITHTNIWFPIIGFVDFGVLYILLASAGLIGTTNGANLLGGFDGMAAGMFVLLFLGIGVILPDHTLRTLAFIAVGANLGFLIYNTYPAKALPGDSYSYFNGALYGSLVILGKVEFIGVIMFLPQIIDMIIRIPYRFKVKWIGRLTKEGYIKPVTKRVETLPVFFMKYFNLREWELSLMLWIVQGIFVILGISFVLR